MAICYCSCTVEQDQTILFESRGEKDGYLLSAFVAGCYVKQEHTVLVESRREKGSYLLL